MPELLSYLQEMLDDPLDTRRFALIGSIFENRVIAALKNFIMMAGRLPSISGKPRMGMR